VPVSPLVITLNIISKSLICDSFFLSNLVIWSITDTENRANRSKDWDAKLPVYGRKPKTAELPVKLLLQGAIAPGTLLHFNSNGLPADIKAGANSCTERNSPRHFAML
jgi:hypothetical protein